MQYEEEKAKQAELEKQLEYLHGENVRQTELIAEQQREIEEIKRSIAVQKGRKAMRCPSCEVVPLQVQAALQSLVGVSASLFTKLSQAGNEGEEGITREELLQTVLDYVEPCKHLDESLDDLYSQVYAMLQQMQQEDPYQRGYQAAGPPGRGGAGGRGLGPAQQRALGGGASFR